MQVWWLFFSGLGKGKDAVSLGRDLIHHFGGLKGMLNANKRTWRRSRVGPAKIAQLLAATEITKRQLKEQIVRNTAIRGQRIWLNIYLSPWLI